MIEIGASFDIPKEMLAAYPQSVKEYAFNEISNRIGKEAMKYAVIREEENLFCGTLTISARIRVEGGRRKDG